MTCANIRANSNKNLKRKIKVNHVNLYSANNYNCK